MLIRAEKASLYAAKARQGPANMNVSPTDPRGADWKRAGDAQLSLSPGTSGTSAAAMRP